MRKGITISVSASNRRRLEAIVSDRNTSQKYAWRSRIILLTGAGVGTNGIMAATGKSKTTVWRWQERFAEAGVEGVLSDKTRPPGKPPVAGARVADLVRLTLEPPPHEATHWTARAMAKAVGLGRGDGAEDLEGARPCSPSLSRLQAVQRPGLRRETARHRRALRQPAGACRGAQRR